MRLAIIQNLYPNYIQNFEEIYLDKLTSYAGSLALLHKDAFAWNGAWGKELADFDIEVIELYVNTDRLNQLWCEENGFNVDKLSIEDVLFEQLKAFNADAVLNTDVKILDSSFISRIKQLTSIKAVFGHICSPYFTKLDVIAYDGIFTCLRYFEQLFQGYGIPSFYLPHCFNPIILEKIGDVPASPKINEVFFAGGILKGKDLHDDREKLMLEFLDGEVPLALYSELFHYNRLKKYGLFLGKSAIYYFNNFLKTLKISEHYINKLPILKEGLSWKHQPGNLVDQRLIKSAKAPLYGIDLFIEMQKYAIAVNIHAGVAQDEAANMRLFEATGIGSALLTDYKANLADFFELDIEVVAYKSFDEAVEKAKYLLANPEIAAKIGKAGQDRILKDHTFKNRAPILAAYVSKALQN